MPMKSAMYKLALIFLVLPYCNAKLVENDVTDINLNSEAKVLVPHKNVCLSDASKDILWVLDLNDDELNYKQLRTANKMDRRVYREVMEPAIINSKYQEFAAGADDKTKNKTETPKQHLDTDLITKYDVKKLILRMFNKFIMPYQGELSLNVHLGDNNKVSIKLYFKGPYTSLVVRYKNKRWNYFINPPSPLPNWFYEKHTNMTRSGEALYVEIPDSVKNEFYVQFFYLLESFISYAL